MPPVFKQLLIVLLVWWAWAAANPLLGRHLTGLGLMVHATLIGAVGVYIVRERHGKFAALGPAATWLFGASYILWGAIDTLWGGHFFIADGSSRHGLGLFISSVCAAYYTVSSCAIVAAVQRPRRLFFAKGPVLLAALVATAVITAMFIMPFLEASRRGVAIYLFSILPAPKIAATISGYILLFLSILVLLTSRSLAWSIYSAGAMCVVLGEFSIRVENILHDKVDLDVYAVLCSFGLYASFLALTKAGRRSKIEPVDFSSLFSAYKFGALAIIFCCLMLFVTFQGHSVDAIRLIAVCCGFASFAAIFLSNFLVARIREFSATMGALLQRDITAAAADAASREGLPTELREHYDLVFARAVQDEKARATQRQNEGRQEVLRQVAHNILSPVAALSSQLDALRALPDDSRLIMKSAIYDISDLAHSLAAKERDGASGTPGTNGPGRGRTRVHLPCLLDSLTAQKRSEHRARVDAQIETSLTAEAYGVHVEVHETELRSVLSNLINNSVEALAAGGSVRLTLQRHGSQIELRIEDNGCGISAERLAKLGQEGATFGKATGSGIGLWHAKKYLAECGGKLDMESTPGRGTTVCLTLPLVMPPKWFAQTIELGPRRHVVILDDKPSIHQIWRSKLGALMARDGLTLHHFSSTAMLKTWFRQAPVPPAEMLFLVDLELQDNDATGLDIIEELQIAPHSLLVTSFCNDAHVRDRCEARGIQMIPKGVASLIEIRSDVNAPLPSPSCDAVLIDDDPLIQSVWQTCARRAGKELAMYASPAAFYAACENLSRTTPIYIDASLGGGVRGEVEANKIYSAFGFARVVLTTAHPADAFIGLPGIAAVIGKMPPWV